MKWLKVRNCFPIKATNADKIMFSMKEIQCERLSDYVVNGDVN